MLVPARCHATLHLARTLPEHGQYCLPAFLGSVMTSEQRINSALAPRRLSSIHFYQMRVSGLIFAPSQFHIVQPENVFEIEGVLLGGGASGTGRSAVGPVAQCLSLGWQPPFIDLAVTSESYLSDRRSLATSRPYSMSWSILAL